MNTAINMPPDAFSFPDAWLFRGAACRTVRSALWSSCSSWRSGFFFLAGRACSSKQTFFS